MEFKTDCKIAGYPGLAHIVVQKYDDSFSVWYGCINVLYGKDGIQSTDEFGEKFLGKTLQMEIEDERSVPIQVVSCQSEITVLCIPFLLYQSLAMCDILLLDIEVVNENTYVFGLKTHFTASSMFSAGTALSFTIVFVAETNGAVEWTLAPIDITDLQLSSDSVNFFGVSLDLISIVAITPSMQYKPTPS